MKGRHKGWQIRAGVCLGSTFCDRLFGKTKSDKKGGKSKKDNLLGSNRKELVDLLWWSVGSVATSTLDAMDDALSDHHLVVVLKLPQDRVNFSTREGR